MVDDASQQRLVDPTRLTTEAMDRIVAQRDALVTAQLTVVETKFEVVRARLEGIDEATTLFRESLVKVPSVDVVEAKFDVIRGRLDAIDKATTVFQDSLVRVPTDVDKQVGNLRQVILERLNAIDSQMLEKFASVSLQFEERDKRGERESRDNKVAVDAAFAAQKEAASEQNKSNTLAISKSEAATAETINKLEQLVSANIQALNDKVDDLKASAAALRSELIANATAIRSEMIAFQSHREGGVDQRAAWKTSQSLVIAGVGLIVAMIVATVTIYAIVKP